jgi:AcrR family transcriptional regulator
MPRAAKLVQPSRRLHSRLNRDVILDAAVSLIEGDGPAALSIRRLGSKLGVEGRAFYHHFDNRDDLLSAIGERLLGWINRKNVLDAITQRLGSSTREIEAGAKAAESGTDADAGLQAPTAPLRGFELVELTIGSDSPALGRRLGEISWAPGCILVAVTERREVMAPRPDNRLEVGERVVLLSPAASATETPQDGGPT